MIQAKVTTIYDNNFADAHEQSIFLLKAIDRHSTKRVNANETNKGDCADPSDYDLQYKLDKHNELIMELFSSALYTESFDDNIEQEYGTSEELATKSDIDSSDCDKLKLSSLRLRSVCPYVVAIVEREDQFPRAISK